MPHFSSLDLIDLMEETGSTPMDRILAVTETFIEVGDTFCIGDHPKSKAAESHSAAIYEVTSAIDVVEVSSLHYNIKAKKIKEGRH